MVTNTLTLVNHASVLIKGAKQSILTDPWYEGEAFHRAWRLLHENNETEIERILEDTTYIWISREHPDHFSRGFFRKYKSFIIDHKIVVLFRHTKDKRVLTFLKDGGFRSMEVPTGEPFTLEDRFTVRVVTDGLYDSALLVNVAGIDIFNVNDCPMDTEKRLDAFRRQYGGCDVLLTEFSYAGFQGARDHVERRRAAAENKLTTLIRQGQRLQATTVIPFGSFIYFANVLNSRMNDAVNTPQVVREACRAANAGFRCVFLKPMESLDLDNDSPKQQASSVSFWEQAFASQKTYIEYQHSYSIGQLSELFTMYCGRLRIKNAWWRIWLCRCLGIAFRPVTVRLVDSGEVLRLDLAKRAIAPSARSPEIAVHSESLAFMFKVAYGFDTLAVNGTLKELRDGGFRRFSRTFAIESRNDVGYPFVLVRAVSPARRLEESSQLHQPKPAAGEVSRAKAA
jgi:hypothetical protein